MLGVLVNLSLVVFFFILLDAITLGMVARWARIGSREALGFVRRGMRLE